MTVTLQQPRPLATVVPISAEVASLVVARYAERVPVERIATELGLDLRSVVAFLHTNFTELSDEQEARKRTAAGYQFLVATILQEGRERGGLTSANKALLLKTLEGERKFLGLDAPTKTETRITSQLTDPELLLTAKRLGVPLGPLELPPAPSE